MLSNARFYTCKIYNSRITNTSRALTASVRVNYYFGFLLLWAMFNRFSPVESVLILSRPRAYYVFVTGVGYKIITFVNAVSRGGGGRHGPVRVLLPGRGFFEKNSTGRRRFGRRSVAHAGIPCRVPNRRGFACSVCRYEQKVVVFGDRRNVAGGSHAAVTPS